MPKDAPFQPSFTTLKVMKVFRDSRGYRASGADIMRALKLPSGTVYPILSRMEDAGLLTAEWEDIDPSEEGRPRRRYYRLTGAGQRVVRDSFNSVVPATGWPGKAVPQ